MEILQGIDIVNIKRFETLLINYGTRFTSRIFHSAELKYCMGLNYTTLCLAARFAAKEAAIKTLTPLIECTFLDFKIYKDGNKPYIKYIGAKELPPGQFALSISHNKQFAIASTVYALNGEGGS